MKTIYNLVILYCIVIIISCDRTIDQEATAQLQLNEQKARVHLVTGPTDQAMNKSRNLVGLDPYTHEQAKNEWATLKFKNYTIDYPTNKRLVKNSEEGNFTLFLLTQPADNSKQTDNITMRINDVEGYIMDLDSYAIQFSDKYFRTTNVHVYENKIISLNNQPCHKFVATVDGRNGETGFKIIVYLLFKDNWAYNLTFTSSMDKYDELKPIAQKVFESLKITN